MTFVEFIKQYQIILEIRVYLRSLQEYQFLKNITIY